MELKTKSHTFELLSADVTKDTIDATFYQNGETPDELTDIFKSSEETSTMHVAEKELSGYTELVAIQIQDSTGTAEDNKEDQKLLAIVHMKKPDLTAEKLKAAITYLGVMNGNTEVTEVLNE